MTKQDEDVAEEEYNIARAAYQCLQLWATCVTNPIVQPVLGFVEKNLRSENWQDRNAAVEAFGAIVDGPDPNMLDPIIKQALPLLIGMMDDSHILVKDSTAFALGRICMYTPNSVDPVAHLQPLVTALFNGLVSNSRTASSCCWALVALADQFAGDPGAQQNPLTPFFQASVTHLLRVTEQ